MDDDTEILDAFECVTEMTSEAAGGMITLPPDLVAEVTQGDEDPRFATIVVESGWSKSKRLWPPEIFDNVAEQINSGQDEPVVGFLGHITPDQDPYAFPDIQFHWLRARVMKAGDKARIAIKGYVAPGKGRDYIKRGVRTFSWAGQAAQIPFEKGMKVTQFQIKSIDLARPRSAGMNARLVGALTSEMETGEGGDEVKPEEIAALSPNELRAHNPAVVKTIEDEARKPVEDKVTEMEGDAAQFKRITDLFPQLKKVLQLEDDADDVSVVTAAITHLKAEGKAMRERILDNVISKRLKGGSDADRALVRRVLVGEMATREISLTGDEAKDEKAISEMVNEVIDGDDSLKKTV
jgi:hypothetical protein